MHEAASLAKADIVAPNGSVVVRDELLRGEAQLVEQFLRASYKGLRYAVERRAGVIPVLMRNLRIKEDLATRGYDAARPALTADGSFTDDAQRKAVDMVVKRRCKDPRRNVFSFVLNKKLPTNCRPRVGSQELIDFARQLNRASPADLPARSDFPALAAAAYSYDID
jgi:hypothetical protein